MTIGPLGTRTRTSSGHTASLFGTGFETRAPIAFTPDLDTDIDWELAFHEAGTDDVRLDVVADECNETAVTLPLGIESLDAELESCD